MSEMESKMRAAGIDVDTARLTEAAYEALRATHGNIGRAALKLEKVLEADPKLLLALWTRDLFIIRVDRFIRERAADMNFSMRGASQICFDRHERDDRSHAPSSSDGSSHSRSDSHPRADRSAARPSTQLPAASHVSDDRLHSSDRRRQPAPSKISKAVGTAVARATSVYDERVVETFDMRWGDITQFDYLNLRVKNAFSKAIEQELEAVSWPDRDTPLRKIVDETRLREMIGRTRAARYHALQAVRSIGGVQ